MPISNIGNEVQIDSPKLELTPDSKNAANLRDQAFHLVRKNEFHKATELYIKLVLNNQRFQSDIPQISDSLSLVNQIYYHGSSTTYNQIAIVQIACRDVISTACDLWAMRAKKVLNCININSENKKDCIESLTKRASLWICGKNAKEAEFFQHYPRDVLYIIAQKCALMIREMNQENIVIPKIHKI